MSLRQKSGLLACLFAAAASFLTAQNVFIQTTVPQDFTVCNTANFSVTVTNAEPTALAALTANVALPAGAEYVAGSISGANQLNISDLQSPVFALQNLAPGASATFSLTVRATCALVSAINSGAKFSNQIHFAWAGGGAKSAETDEYRIETPLLVLTASMGQNAFGALGAQVTRVFTVRNTRLGALSSFIFQDLHTSGGFALAVNHGAVLTNTSTELKIALGAADFQQIGDHDDLFELDEEITLVETLTVTDCGISLTQSVSNLAATWGCGADVCQTATATARVNIYQADVNPKLAFTPHHGLSEDFCGDRLATQRLTIRNIGKGPAIGATILVNAENYAANQSLAAAIDPATVRFDSAGQTRNALIINAKVDTMPRCPQFNVISQMTVALPTLRAGDSLDLVFGLRTCDDYCQNTMPTWRIERSLPLNCPPGLFDTTALRITAVPSDQPQQVDILCIAKPLRDDEVYPFTFRLVSQQLRDSVGRLRVTFALPCGLSWVGGAPKIDGQQPTASGIVPTGDGQERWYEYALPLDSSQAVAEVFFKWDCDAPCVSKDSCTSLFSANFCQNGCDFDPDTLPAALLETRAEMLLDPALALGCGFKTCQKYALRYECLDTCTTPIRGYVEHETSFLRSSFGLPDNDDDRWADAGNAMFDFSKIRRDRFLPGDTAQLVMRGAIHAAQPGATFEHALLRVYFESHKADDGYMGGVAFDYNRAGDVLSLGCSLRIFDQSSGQNFDCALPAPAAETDIVNYYTTLNINNLACLDTLDRTAAQFFTHDISVPRLVAAGCALPPDFKFAEGDSVVLSEAFRFMRDPRFSQVYNLRVKTFASVFNGYQPSGLPLNHNAPEQDFSCSCPHKLIQLTGTRTTLSKIKIYLDPCDPSDQPQQARLDVEIGAGNFFPHEFRPLARIADWWNRIPPPITIASQQVAALTLQGGPTVVSNFPLPFAQASDSIFRFETSNLPAVDEGFSIQLRQQFSAPCFFAQLAEHQDTIALAWQPPLPNAGIQNITQWSRIDPIKKDTTGFIPVRPLIFASGPNLNYLSSDDRGVWSLNVVHAGGSVPAYSSWIFFENPSGGLANLQVFRLPTNTPVPQINGIFQLGDIPPGGLVQIRVEAENTTCKKESLTVFYGWNCSAVSSTTEQTCARKTLGMSVTPQNAELDLDIQTPAASIDLCDTTDYHNLRIFNALQGAAFGVQAQIKLPPGLEIVPGSCQISYPTGANWQSIPDPSPAPGFGLGWPLAALSGLIAQNGLAGFQQAPFHSVSLRFRARSVCGFITGEQILYRTFGDQGCGDSTNILLKPGQPILLNGVAPAADVQIALSAGLPQPVSCADVVPVSVSFLSNAASGNRDSLVVTLPPGATFVAGSYLPGANAPSSPPTVMQLTVNQILMWKLKPGVAAGSAVQMTFSATGFGAQGCLPLDTIFIKTTQQQTAVCVADGSICDATATSGEAFLTVKVYHPQFELVDFDVNFDAGIAGYRVKLKNAGAQQHAAPTYFKFYRDADGSGTLTPGDVKKHEAAIFFPIGAGSAVDLAGALPIDLADLCHLIVVLEGPEMCFCDTLALPIDSVSRKIDPKLVCSGAFINLGVAPMPGHHYLWSPGTALECDTCPYPKFQFENMTTQPAVFQYVFTESAGDCSVASDFTVTVLPQPQILTPNTAICAGETVTISTTPGVNFEWFGSGIANPTLPTQTVSPLATSQYFVRITDAAGCQSIDTVLITVKPTPFAEIGPDSLGVCGAADLQFHAFYNPDFQYQWSPAGLVSNPNVADPFFTGTASATLVLKTSIAGSDCVDNDTVAVVFSENPVISASAAAVTNCIGDTALVLLNGAKDYFWAPSAGVFCLSQNCANVQLLPLASTTYTIVGFNQYGCSDTLLLPVAVPGAVQNTASQMSICAGETATIFGQAKTQSGVYCRTFSGINGCDSTHCVTLTVRDTLHTEQAVVICPGTVAIIGGITYEQPGRFCQTLVGANGCDSTHCVVVTEAAEPVGVDTLYRVVGAQDSVVQLSLPSGFAAYEWSPAQYLSCTDCANPLATVPGGIDSATYRVTVTNASGCTREVVVILRLLPPCDPQNIAIPNAFTPDNGDQTNQTFRVPPHEGFEQLLSLRIYDRWGEMVFATNDPANIGWDGRGPRGKPVPSDVYVYILEVGCPSGSARRAGDITVLR